MNKIFLAFLTAFTFFGSNAFSQGGENISPTEFSQQIMAHANDIQIIDVRTPGEFNGGHLKNAENIDYNDRKFKMEVATLDKNKPTYIYCLSGGRSNQAMQLMLSAGFTKVYNMKGGIMAWRKAKLPVEGDMSAKAGLSMDEFMNLVNQDVPVLVDFNATWCGPCRVLKPRVAQLAKANPNNLKVLYIDVDQNKALSDELGIRAIPLLHLYKNGKLKRVKNEAISYKELERFIR